MKKLITFIAYAFVFVFFYHTLNAQNKFPSTGAAGIGTTSPNSSSLLEIRSTAKGFLMSRMTKAQRDAIPSPATGLMIYQTNSTPGFYYYTGSGWKAVTPKAGWSLTGNAGTDSSINFLGTTDAHSLVFKVNNLQAGLIEYSTCCSGKRNTAFGQIALNSNTSGIENTATGYGALYTNTTGNNNSAYGKYALFNNNGSHNSALGFNAMFFNTTGANNTATGSTALQNNTTSSNNTAHGWAALYSNNGGNENTALGGATLNGNVTGKDNTATGFAALNNNNANYNTATGVYAMYVNVNGSYNTATGGYALQANASGKLNTANGYGALYSNTTGDFNTAVGHLSLTTNISGVNNSAFGANADVNDIARSNATAIGSGAIATADNQVMLGNTAVTSVKAAASFVIYSDGRFKKNIKDNVPGLEFIRMLKAVTYNYDIHELDAHVKGVQSKERKQNTEQAKQNEEAISAKEKKIYTGFLAQDVEAAAKKIGYDFSGVYKPQNSKDAYGLSYADFVVPLVKAVQELSAKNDDLQKQIDELKVMIVSSQSTINGQQSTVIFSASLEQNIPNPFTNSTTINYTLPQKFASAQIVITDKNGKTLKAVNISGSGKGSLTVNSSTLAAGAYQYSLIIDGKLIATKQMVLAK